MKSDFNNINILKISNNVLPQTRTWLYEAGMRREEAFVLWAGVFENKTEFIVTTAILPDQRSLRSQNGIGVYIDGKELFNINKWLYENNLVLIGQVHSHPTEAFHSSTDDTFPLVNAIGQFSIVVPYFAKAPKIYLDLCAIYRLNSNGRWENLRNNKTNCVFEEL